MSIHPTAVVADGARLGAGVVVGPCCVVGPRVVLEDGVTLHGHVVVQGDTVVGEGTDVFPFAALGAVPQDKKVSPEQAAAGKLRIGKRNVIRENVTMHPGTPFGEGITRVGDGGTFLVGSHVAHDCRIGDGVVMTNLASLAGHVVLEDRALLGAMVGVHQFARLGTLAMAAAGSMVSQDVPPYCLVQGDRSRLIGLNQVGLRRAGVPQESYLRLREAFRRLFWDAVPLAQAIAETETVYGDDPYVARILMFLRGSRRGVCPSRRVLRRLSLPVEGGPDSL